MTHRHKAKKTKLNKINSKYLWIVLGFLIVLNIMAIFTIASINYYESQKPKVNSLGQSQTINGVTFTASDVRVETKYVMGLVPGVNEEMVSLNLTVQNGSKQKFEIFPSIHTFIRSGEGDNYQLTPVDMENLFPENVIYPGQTVSGRLAYKVSNRNIPMKLYIESSDNKASPYIVRVR